MAFNKVDYKEHPYTKSVQERSFLCYFLGLLVRWKQNIKYEKARRIARKNGAKIGEGVIMPISLAKKLNAKTQIGNHVSIQTDEIDTRSDVIIGDHVIIGSGVQILTASHNVDSPFWEYKSYGITIEDYVWIPTNVLVLPSCRVIGKGAVIGAGSVVVKSVDSMSIVSGNPAQFIRQRSCVHDQLVVEGLLGGDYNRYKQARHSK